MIHHYATYKDHAVKKNQHRNEVECNLHLNPNFIFEKLFSPVQSQINILYKTKIKQGEIGDADNPSAAQ